jgi:RNA polymerase sigma factor (TIGR02999 family)
VFTDSICRSSKSKRRGNRVLIEPATTGCYSRASKSHFTPLALMSNSEVQPDLTQMLQANNSGVAVSQEFLPLVYKQLRELAAARMAREMEGQTLQPTALVHEAWLRLQSNSSPVWRNRAHFFGAASEAMRRILIERARRKLRLKRGNRAEHISIENVDVAQTEPDERILLIDEALTHLKTADPELARIVTLKFFGGLTNAEVAEALGVTERTIYNKWTFAKAWLLKNIREERNSES